MKEVVSILQQYNNYTCKCYQSFFDYYRNKPADVILDDGVLSDEGDVEIDGKLVLRLDEISAKSKMEHKYGLDNPLYGAVSSESQS